VIYFCVFAPFHLVKRFGENKEMRHMDERIPCPLCRHGNLPENRFCGHCGVLMTSRGQLTPRPEANPTAAIRSLPTKLGPVGKTLAVGLAVLATEAGLAWLRHRVNYDGRPSPPAPQTVRSAGSEHTIGQSLEEVFVWLQEEGNFQGRGIGRRVVWTSEIAKGTRRRR
jgi:hypothetical protein